MAAVALREREAAFNYAEVISKQRLYLSTKLEEALVSGFGKRSDLGGR